MTEPRRVRSLRRGFASRLGERLRQVRGRPWLRAFVVLLALSVLAELWATPGRNLFPVYCEASLGKAPYFASSLVSVRLVLGALAAIVGGGLSDALGPRRVFVLGLSGIPALGLLYLTGSPWLLVALNVYIGFTGGAYYLGAEVYMLATVPMATIGTATALLFMAQTMGGALGGMVAAEMMDSSFRSYGLLHTVVAGAVLLLGLALLPTVGRPTSAPARDSRSYLPVLRRRPVILLAALRFVPTLYYGTASLLMPLLIYRAAGTASAAALYTTASLVFASLCQLVAGRLCDRSARGVFIITVTAGLSVAGVAAALTTTSLAGLFACGLLGNGLAWALAVAIPGLVNDVSPRTEQGRVLAVTHVSWYAGMVVGTQAAGFLVTLGDGVPFALAAAANCVAVVAAVVLLRGMGGAGTVASEGHRASAETEPCSPG